MPTSTGYEIAEGPHYDWDGRKRGHTPFTVLQHTISGRGRLQYERHFWNVKPGMTMLVSVPHSHRYWVEPNEKWEFFWIAFSGQEALRLHHAILNSVGPVFCLCAETVDQLAGISLLLNQDLSGAGRASSLAYEATMLLHDDVVGADDHGHENSGHSVIDRTVGYIRENLDMPLDIATLATYSGMSRAYFTRLFTQKKGVSPAEFVLQQRMERAARLLVNGQLSIKAISSSCGFSDPNYFTKAFRRTYSVSPSEFRTTGMYAARP